MYPLNRHRRLRVNETLRALIRETVITPNDFLVPLFVIEGQNIKEEIQLVNIVYFHEDRSITVQFCNA